MDQSHSTPIVVGNKPVQDRVLTRLAWAASKEVVPSVFVGTFVGLLQSTVPGRDPVAIGTGIAVGAFLYRGFVAMWKEYKQSKKSINNDEVLKESTSKPKM